MNCLDSDPDGEPSPTAVYPVAFMTTAMLLFKDSLGQWVPVRKNGAINENSTFDNTPWKDFCSFFDSSFREICKRSNHSSRGTTYATSHI